MRTGNPVLQSEEFSQWSGATSWDRARPDTMTIQGTATKTLMLLGFVFGTATLAWSQTLNGGLPYPWIIGGTVVGAITSIILMFVPKWAMVLAPVYAIAQGLALGGVSALVDRHYPGIAVQATAATFGTLFGLLLAYKTRLIRATENFKLGVVAATGGIAVLYLVSMCSSMFFGFNIPYIHEAGPIGIGFSMFVVVLAALNLVLDFDFIENASANGAPKYMEWYAAYGLLVTLVWLYIEIVRLLIKLQSNRE